MEESRSASTWRTALHRTFGVLFVLGLLLSTVAIWANVRVQDSDSWADTVGPLADDPAVQEYVVDQATTLIAQQIAVDEDAGRLQNFTRNQVTTLARIALIDFVTSPTFVQWWTEANRTAHSVAMNVMNDGESDLLNTHGGDLVLNLQPAVDWVNGNLSVLFPNSSYTIAISDERATVVLYSSETLAQITNILELIDTLAILLPVITLVAMFGAIMTARNRVESIMYLGFSMAVGSMILLVLFGLGRVWFIGQQEPAVQDLLDAILRVMLVDLLGALRVLALFGLGVAGLVAALRSKYVRNPRVRAFFHDNRELLAGSMVGIAVIALVLTEYPPVLLSLGTLLVTLGGVYLMLRWRGEGNSTTESLDKPADS